MGERKSFLLRVDSQLWAELEAWAADELRSVNGQIEYLLRDAVQKRRGGSATEPLPQKTTETRRHRESRKQDR
jgi:hypothetical protein